MPQIHAHVELHSTVSCLRGGREGMRNFVSTAFFMRVLQKDGGFPHLGDTEKKIHVGNHI